MSDVNDRREAPGVEDNGYWFAVFLTIFIVLFGTAFVALIHSLASTFGG